MNFKEFVKKIDWKHVLILLMIFLVAFSFRTHILRYDTMFGFDGYWHARMNAEWIENGKFPEFDLDGTYHNMNERPIKMMDFIGFWTPGYVAYKVISLGGDYDKDLWIHIIRFLPALYGALTAMAAYLLFRWAYKSKKIGYLAGVFTAIVPGLIYRQMGGFYEEDSLGFFWMVLGFAFLVRAVREEAFTKSSATYAALSGLAFAIMSITWHVFVIVPLLLEAYAIITLLWNWYKGVDKKKLTALAGLFAISFVVTTGIATVVDGTSWFDSQVSYAKGFLGIEGGTSVQNVGVGVGEENTGHQYFGTKYGVFNIFFILGLIAGIYGLFRKKQDFTTWLFLLWGLLTFYLAWNKLKATYWYGLGLAILTTLTFAEVYLLSVEKRFKVTSKVIAVSIGFLLLMGGIASGVLFVHNHSPSMTSSPGWNETIEFFENELPQGAKVFNWWNWGHWITFIGEKKASTDNTNSDQQANKDFSRFITDSNTEHALGIIKAYDPDYIVFEGGDIAKQGVYATYAYNSSEVNPGARQGFVLNCSRSQNKVSGAVTYNCGQNTIPQNQMLALSTTWQDRPNEIINGKTPVFYYTNKDKSKFYRLPAGNNNSFGAKLWFGAQETLDYFDVVYDNSYQKIWKVNKEAFEDIEPYMTDLNSEQVEEWNNNLYKLELEN